MSTRCNREGASSLDSICKMFMPALPENPEIAMFSTVIGRRVAGEKLDAS